MDLKKIQLSFRKYLDKIVVGLLAILLLALFMLYSNEQAAQVGDLPTIPVVDPPVIVSEKALERVESFLDKNSNIEDNEEYMVLITQNPFEYKAVRDLDAIIADANVHYNNAVSFYEQGNLEGALGELRRALTIYPDHRRAREMRTKIEQELTAKTE